MLPRAGFGYDAMFAHVLGQQGLPEGVVDLVGAGMGQVFTLQVDSGAAEVAGEVLGEIQRGRAPDVGI